ncbi:inositol monophosphatase family protein [Magnetovibrio blakemorei]|uniref:Inositol-1-monophosphatase n=1 Tax=Magnetovibrio blakemorei TaxID=28181 RepID=A0A1E5QAD9_9PROT|nr:inositol monophosphatase family protein [Magnetovibrio blakemorei]OEJ68684.1 inositol monophosphatase [Magnetovibrio blakemorei]
MAHPRSALLNVMTAAAQKAARRLTRDFGEVENLQVSKKGPADFVSNADKKAEDTLVKELQKARPDYGFILEEANNIEGKDSSNTWVIDPLDGTTNFLHGIPHFAISIGLLRDGEPFAGVVYNPITDEMFWAEKGQGAFLNGRRLRVSARAHLSEGLFATGLPFLGKEKDGERFMQRVNAVTTLSAGVRRFGSAALDLAYVAAARYDGYWESGLQAWDIAAGIVLVREAGGFVTDMDGKRKMLENGSVIAATDKMHEPLFNLIK